MAFDKNRYIQDFKKDKYDHVQFLVAKGKRKVLRDLAVEHNITDDKGRISVGALIVKCIEEKYGVNLGKDE